MSVLMVGLSHRTAPVTLLERASLTGDAPQRLLRAAAAAAQVNAAALVATCNRIELYADVDNVRAGVAELSELLAEYTGVDPEELTPYLGVRHGDRAVQHLFSLACGLDSMVVGEAQILGQLRNALSLAQDEHTAGRRIGELFQQALRVGKRAHSETGIARAGQSLVAFGLEQVAKRVGPIAGKRGLVVGAGSMSSLAAATLARAGVSELVIANRTPVRAERLAATLAAYGARTVPYEDVATALAEADVVISCGGVAGRNDTSSSRGGRQTAPAPLAVLDLAMPGDADAAARELEGVHLVGLDTLAEAARNVEDAAGALDVAAVRRIVAEEVDSFTAAQRAAGVTQTVVALRASVSEMVDSELERLCGRLPELDATTRAELTQSLNRLVRKVLHAPTVRVKQRAGEPGGESYAEALCELFGLDPAAVRTSPAVADRPQTAPPAVRVARPDQRARELRQFEPGPAMRSTRGSASLA
ncbi:glutamyl-tRNA reductase [Streptomyces sp. NBC_01481]|uniref:glutamyl-tRNA reductase n=1 Tax=Streptomyces sp. NBC_01481 TaxID=2975869 RepID=UPI002252D51F|nr:glutamyl-tRNA reductase [Streptomyces sp. NBC_01481]MCX4583625.1 glutamyl-tRNA reductase [Streptomyces sp. NBC_01481]